MTVKIIFTLTIITSNTIIVKKRKKVLILLKNSFRHFTIV